MISSRRFASLRQLCLWAALLGGALQVFAQSTVYWDTNGNSSGAGMFNSGTWSQSTGANWTTNSSGTSNTTTWSSVAAGAKIADFSAGSDSITTSVTVNGTINDLAGLAFNNGLIWLSGSNLSFSGASATIAANTLQASIANSLSGSTAVEKTGWGMLVLSGNSTLSGGVTLSAGTLALGHDRAVGTGTFTINAGTVQSNAARTIANNVAIGGNFTIGGSNDLTFNGTVNLGGGMRIITVDNSGVTTFAGSIIEPWYSGITKAGTGELVLAGSNSFRAPVTVSGGTLTLAHGNALGEAGTYNNAVNANATIQLKGGITVTESFDVIGTGAGASGALRNASGVNTINGTVTLQGNSTFTAASGTLGITGQIQIGNANTLTTTGAGNFNLAGPVHGQTLTQAGSGTVTLGGSADNSFSTLNVNDGTVVLAKTSGAHAIAASTINVGDGTGSSGTAVLRLNGSNQIADYAGTLTIRSDGLLDLNNFTEGVNSIAGTGVIDLGDTGSLTIGTNSGNSSFGGAIAGTGTLTKTGSGTLEFTDDLDFAGTFVLNAGTLRLGATDLKLDSLSVTGSSTIDFAGVGGRLEIGTLQLAANITLTILNWTEDDRFEVDTWLGAAYNVSGAPMNQVVFSGYSGGATRWNSFDNSVTPYPVPEPATTGALLVAGAAGLLAWRRRRVS